jgi:hypothetical protein
MSIYLVLESKQNYIVFKIKQKQVTASQNVILCSFDWYLIGTIYKIHCQG